MAIAELRGALAEIQYRAEVAEWQRRSVAREVYGRVADLLQASSHRRFSLNALLLIPPLIIVGLPLVALYASIKEITFLDGFTNIVSERHVDNGDGNTTVLLYGEASKPSRASEVRIEVPGISRLSVYREGYASIEDYNVRYANKWINSRIPTIPELQAHQRLLQRITA